MFTLGEVTLRPLDLDDFERAYAWHLDQGLEILAGWGRRRSRTTYRKKLEEFLESPPNDLQVFIIEVTGRPVGRIELSMIDREQQRASFGLLLGERDAWGKGYGSTATRLLLDYSFMVENLVRIYAHVFSFNRRSLEMMRRLGFAHEGILRQHEIHNGLRCDLHIFGIMKDEFYSRYATAFPVPGLANEPGGPSDVPP